MSEKPWPKNIPAITFCAFSCPSVINNKIFFGVWGGYGGEDLFEDGIMEKTQTYCTWAEGRGLIGVSQERGSDREETGFKG